MCMGWWKVHVHRIVLLCRHAYPPVFLLDLRQLFGFKT